MTTTAQVKLLEKMHSGSFGVYVPTPESEANRKRLNPPRN